MTMELDNNNNNNNNNVNFAFGNGINPSSSSMSSQILGLIVPGGPVHTEFVPMDNTGTKYGMTLTSPGQLPTPLTSVNEIVCFIVPPWPFTKLVFKL